MKKIKLNRKKISKGTTKVINALKEIFEVKL